MRFAEYRKHDAISLAGLIAKREVSAKEVLETAIARAEQINPAINAIVHKQYGQALKAVAAGLPEGPLKGVPYLIKDLGFFETGEPATFGSSLFKDFVADHDTAYVMRCKKAGLVFMGRSSSPEFGLNPNTEPRLYGSCHNPWDLEYSPGGSSGGAAAAVYRGYLACGACNRWRRLHPNSSGAVRPVRAQAVARPGVNGAGCGRRMGWAINRARGQPQRARLGTMLDCTAGPEPGDPYAAPVNEHPFLEAIAGPPRRLRIALMLEDHRGAKLHPECLEAVQNAAELCAGLCPNCSRRSRQYRHGSIAADECPDSSAANTARSCNMRWKVLGRQPNADDLEAVTWAVYQRGLKVSGVEYIEAIAAAHAAGARAVPHAAMM